MAIIYGTAGNDTLTGTTQDDQIYGLAGNDELIGGFGRDYLEGDVVMIFLLAVRIVIPLSSITQVAVVI